MEKSGISNHQVTSFYQHINLACLFLEKWMIQLLGTIELFNVIFIFWDMFVQSMTLQVRTRYDTQAAILPGSTLGTIVASEQCNSRDGSTRIHLDANAEVDLPEVY